MSELLEVFETVDSSEEVTTTTEAEEVTETTEEQSELPLEEPKEEPEKPEIQEDQPKDIPYDDLPDWTKQRLKDDRNKAQEAKRERDEALAELEKLRSQVQPETKEEETPDIFDDQEGFKNALQNQFKQELANQRLELSRTLMMEVKSDYQDVETYVIEAAKSDQSFANFIRAEANKHPNPAKFIYEQGLKHQKFEKMQNADKFEQDLRAKIRAELEQEMKANQEERAKKSSNLSPTLTNVSGSSVQEKTYDTLSSMFD